MPTPTKLATDSLSRLGQGQRARLRFDDGDTLEVRVNQMEHVPDQRLRLELTGDESSDADRYRAEAHVEEDGWTVPTVERFDRIAGTWEPGRQIEAVSPLETFCTMMSADMAAQAWTGTEGAETEGE